MELRLVSQRESVPEIIRTREAEPIYEAEVIETSPLQPQKENRRHSLKLIRKRSPLNI